MVNRFLALFGLLALLGSGCGDIGMVRVNVEFPDEDTELRTRALRFIVRQVPETGDGCADFFQMAPTSLPQNESVIAYPNRNDIVAANVRLAMYSALTLIVYAYPSADLAASQPIAGGCMQPPIDAESTSDLSIALTPAP